MYLFVDILCICASTTLEMMDVSQSTESEDDIWETSMDTDDDIFGKLEFPRCTVDLNRKKLSCNMRHPRDAQMRTDFEENPVVNQSHLMTEIGHRDYSLLKEIRLDGQNAERDDTRNESASHIGHERTITETTTWLSPEELLEDVETRLSKNLPKLAVSGTLGAFGMSDAQWSTPVLPFVLGELPEPVPKGKHKEINGVMYCSRHRGYSVIDDDVKRKATLQRLYKMSYPEIHASSLMAMVIHTKLQGAMSCYNGKVCQRPHLIDEVVVNTKSLYTDIKKQINETSWPYVKKFVNIESFVYTTRVFVRGVFVREVCMTGSNVHEPLTLVYPTVVVGSSGIDLSATMKDSLELPTRGLVEISDFVIVIECHGPRASTYRNYSLDPLCQRMEIVCVCDEDGRSTQPCFCGKEYINTLINPYNEDPHHLAAFHMERSLHSTIAYNTFVLIDELTRGQGISVNRDCSMRGNNVILQMKPMTHKAAYISHDTKFSFSHQPAVFTTIYVSSVLLKTAKDVVNAVGQMCATVLFMMRYGNTKRTIDNDRKYNEIVNQITQYFPTMGIRTLPPPRLTNPLHRVGCDICGGEEQFIKKGITSVLVCNDCQANTTQESLPKKLTIGDSDIEFQW